MGLFLCHCGDKGCVLAAAMRWEFVRAGTVATRRNNFFENCKGDKGKWRYMRPGEKQTDLGALQVPEPSRILAGNCLSFMDSERLECK